MHVFRVKDKIQNANEKPVERPSIQPSPKQNEMSNKTTQNIWNGYVYDCTTVRDERHYFSVNIRIWNPSKCTAKWFCYYPKTIAFTSPTTLSLINSSLCLSVACSCLWRIWYVHKWNNEHSYWRTNRKIVLKPLCTHTIKLLASSVRPNFMFHFHPNANKQHLFVKRQTCWSIGVLSTMVVNFSKKLHVFPCRVSILGLTGSEFFFFFLWTSFTADVSHTHYSGNINL